MKAKVSGSKFLGLMLATAMTGGTAQAQELLLGYLPALAGPPEGGCGPAPPKPGPETGAAPLVKAESFAGDEAGGGAIWPLGSGAGNAPCAKA